MLFRRDFVSCHASLANFPIISLCQLLSADHLNWWSKSGSSGSFWSHADPQSSPWLLNITQSWYDWMMTGAMTRRKPPIRSDGSHVISEVAARYPAGAGWELSLVDAFYMGRWDKHQYKFWDMIWDTVIQDIEPWYGIWLYIYIHMYIYIYTHPTMWWLWT